MSSVHQTIEVEVPVHVAYEQWTRFEEFPRFMEGVEQVERIDEATLRWHVSIAGVDRSFRARIEEQEPDRRISWRATEGERQAGTVRFEALDGQRTRIELEMAYDPADWKEKAADMLSLLDNRVAGDLQRFKAVVEGRDDEAGVGDPGLAAYPGEGQRDPLQDPSRRL